MSLASVLSDGYFVKSRPAGKTWERTGDEETTNTAVNKEFQLRLSRETGETAHFGRFSTCPDTISKME